MTVPRLSGSQILLMPDTHLDTALSSAAMKRTSTCNQLDFLDELLHHRWLDTQNSEVKRTAGRPYGCEQAGVWRLLMLRTYMSVMGDTCVADSPSP